MRALRRPKDTLAFAAATLVCLTSVARADGDACAAAFSAGPELVKEGRLVAGRAELQRCASSACPAAMSGLCADDLRRLEGRIPTVVLAATDAAGHDLTDVRVSEDGKLLAEQLEGRAFELDPGVHRFRFERAGSTPAETTVVVREGEKDRVVTAKLAPPPGPPVSIETRPIPWSVYAAGGATLVAAGAYAYFGILGLRERDDLASCKGACSQDAVDNAESHLRIADAFLVATVVGASVTATLFLTRPKVTTFAISPGLGSVVVAGRF